jgi:hypothetical protein
VEFQKKHSIAKFLGFGFAVMIPFTMVNLFSSKYNIDHYYPKLVRNLLVLASMGAIYYGVHASQKRLHEGLIHKYFGQYSDADILKFDIMMEQHRAAMQ